MLIETKIKELPTNSGVYIMKNKDGEVIYVGKAKNLKNRVTQYFQNSKSHTLKVATMVSNIADFEYILVPNEHEALALENNLIKRYQPQYNILLKDNKSYPYIRVDEKLDFPKFTITRKIKKDGARYFGPYFNGSNPTQILKMLNNAYPLRTCGGNTITRHSRACINYELGLCSAPCMNYITKTEYKTYVKNAINFLNGNTSQIKEQLKTKMQYFADKEQFETALLLRDNLKMLDKINAQTITFMPTLDNIDAFSWASNGAIASVAVVIVRGGKSVGVDTFHLVDAELNLNESLTQFIMQYYSANAIPPEQVVIPFEPTADLQEWLNMQVKGNKNKVKLIYAQKGKNKKLLEIANENAISYLDKAVEKEKRLHDFTTGACQKLSEILGMNKTIRRMECYDISNIGGVFSVASMVVSFDGVAKPSHYRKFRIKTVIGANDFASMYEVLTRRFNEMLKPTKDDPSFSQVPDLIVIDGGKGQLSNAQKAMNDCGCYVQMIGLAKREEEIFLPNTSEPIVLPHTHNSLKLIQRIRDESHRFAITFHRSLRNKIGSILEDIEGIGKLKGKALIRHFKSIQNIKEANLQELQKVKGITIKNALAIKKYFETN